MRIRGTITEPCLGLRRIIETMFSQLEEYGLRFIRAASRKGSTIKITLSILAFNISQIDEESLVGSTVYEVIWFNIGRNREVKNGV